MTVHPPGFMVSPLRMLNNVFNLDRKIGVVAVVLQLSGAYSPVLEMP